LRRLPEIIAFPPILCQPRWAQPGTHRLSLEPGFRTALLPRCKCNRPEDLAQLSTLRAWLGAIMTLFLSLAFAVGGLMLGEVWSWIAESHRIGNSHMSHRVDRLWWVQHRAALFPGALVVFWLASARGARVKLRPYSDRIA